MGLRIKLDRNAVCFIGDGRTGRLLGTGFACLRREWMVTAKHVVFRDGLLLDQIVIHPLEGGPYPTELLFAHPELDLAVLRWAGGPVRTPLYPGHERFTGSAGLICVGYAPSLGKVNGSAHLFVNEITKYERETRSRRSVEEELITFSAPFLEGGHSGGPVLGEGGSVVGVIIQGFGGESGYCGRATGIHPILDSLRFD